MTPTNNGRPLPWHDTATCGEKAADGGYCSGPMVPVGKMVNGYGGPSGSRIACVACGHGRVGSAEDVAKATRSARAWEMYEAGEVHADRGCLRCNGPLPAERSRMCAACVAQDNDERQGVLL